MVKHNIIAITQTPGLIFQDYPKPRFLLNLGLDFFVIPAIDILHTSARGY